MRAWLRGLWRRLFHRSPFVGSFIICTSGDPVWRRVTKIDKDTVTFEEVCEPKPRGDGDA